MSKEKVEIEDILDSLSEEENERIEKILLEELDFEKYIDMSKPELIYHYTSPMGLKGIPCFLETAILC